MPLGNRLHVTFAPNIKRDRFSLPRCYTLTHSDVTGELFLTVGQEIDHEQISGWYTRFMRDEVTAKWQQENEKYALHLYCHASGGIVFGTARMRYGIFQQHMPLVLQALHEGDQVLFQNHPKLEEAAVQVHFAARQKRYRKIEVWGKISQY